MLKPIAGVVWTSETIRGEPMPVLPDAAFFCRFRILILVLMLILIRSFTPFLPPKAAFVFAFTRGHTYAAYPSQAQVIRAIRRVGFRFSFAFVISSLHGHLEFVTKFKGLANSLEKSTVPYR
jgi:hypothetical protein